MLFWRKIVFGILSYFLICSHLYSYPKCNNEWEKEWERNSIHFHENSIWISLKTEIIVKLKREKIFIEKTMNDCFIHQFVETTTHSLAFELGTPIYHESESGMVFLLVFAIEFFVFYFFYWYSCQICVWTPSWGDREVGDGITCQRTCWSKRNQKNQNCGRNQRVSNWTEPSNSLFV